MTNVEWQQMTFVVSVTKTWAFVDFGYMCNVQCTLYKCTIWYKLWAKFLNQLYSIQASSAMWAFSSESLIVLGLKFERLFAYDYDNKVFSFVKIILLERWYCIYHQQVKQFTILFLMHCICGSAVCWKKNSFLLGIGHKGIEQCWKRN